MRYNRLKRSWLFVFLKGVFVIFLTFIAMSFLTSFSTTRRHGKNIYENDGLIDNRISTFHDSDEDSLGYILTQPRNSFVRPPLQVEPSISDSETREYYSGLKRLVHLDLKGAPPRVEKYGELFPLFKRLSATGLLIEWEDMFPYSGNLTGISATNAYSYQEVQLILQTAKTNGLEVIPLVQTFGHLEFVLKHEKYIHLRELPFSPLSITPFLLGTYEVIFDMLNQILNAHADIKHIHIGCDEVFGIGTGQSQTIMGKEKMTTNQIFLSHVIKVAKFVLSRYPNIKPIIWDDMIRNINKLDLQHYGIGTFVEPMVWSYSTDLAAFQWPPLWETYGDIFGTVWVASAFKGASGPAQIITDHNKHVQNHLEWVKILNMFARGSQRKVNVRGIALTGWQRFDHFATLCELLPVSMTSLGICLQTFMGGSYNDEVIYNVTKILKCKKMLRLEVIYNSDQWCNYPGFEIQQDIQKIYFLDFPEREHLKAYLNDHQMKYKVSNPWMIRDIYKTISTIWLILSSAKSSLRRSLASYYDGYTVNEWFEIYLNPLQQKYERYKLELEAIKQKTVFPRRPFAAQII